MFGFNQVSEAAASGDEVVDTGALLIGGLAPVRQDQIGDELNRSDHALSTYLSTRITGSGSFVLSRSDGNDLWITRLIVVRIRGVKR